MTPWENLEFPKAVRQMPSEVLPKLCLALKQHMTTPCALQPEGLQALSAVELTVALHRVFRNPYEAVLFEKEPWALAHRLLVGHRQGFLSPSQAKTLPHPEDVFDKNHGPLVLAFAMALLKTRKLSNHRGKVVVVLEERRPLHKESFETLSQPEAASLPWVLLLVRAGGEGGGLSHVALAEFFGSLGFLLWPTVEGSHLSDMEAAFRLARLAHKPVVIHIKLS